MPLLRTCLLLATVPALLVARPGRAAAQPLTPAGETAADLKPVETDSQGSGPSRDAAISKALANALAQETGVDVGQANISGSVQGSATITGPGAGPKPGTTTLDAQLASNAVVSTSGGHVVRYTVLSVQADPGGGFTAHVHAVLAVYRRQTGAADNRKRIAVASFDSDARNGLAEALHDQLIIDLTQSRRFAVVDRAHDEAYQSEIAAVTGGDAAPEEKARAGQMLGADYVLLGKLHVTGARTTGAAARTDSHVLELTGEVVSHTTASTLRTTPGAATAEFELMEVATREIKLADRAGITGSGVEMLAQRITDDLLATIYPPRLVKADDPEALIINQGGEGMHAGLRFRLMAEGQELFDPYTHESLGRTERQVGVIEVTEVATRMSNARLVSGELPPAGATAVLRPEKHAAEPAVVAAVRHRVPIRHAAAAAAQPDTGLKLPFDH